MWIAGFLLSFHSKWSFSSEMRSRNIHKTMQFHNFKGISKDNCRNELHKFSLQILQILTTCHRSNSLTHQLSTTLTRVTQRKEVIRRGIWLAKRQFLLPAEANSEGSTRFPAAKRILKKNKVNAHKQCRRLISNTCYEFELQQKYCCP